MVAESGSNRIFPALLDGIVSNCIRVAIDGRYPGKRSRSRFTWSLALRKHACGVRDLLDDCRRPGIKPPPSRGSRELAKDSQPATSTNYCQRQIEMSYSVPFRNVRFGGSVLRMDVRVNVSARSRV